MKLVVNVSCLQGPLTGIGYYTLNLLKELYQAPHIQDIQGISTTQCYTMDELWQRLCELEHNCGAEPGRSPSQPSGTMRRYVAAIPGARQMRHRVMAVKARRRAAQYCDYVYWEPNYLLLPLAGTAVTTVHDLSHIRFPQYHPVDRVRLMEKQLMQSLRTAAKVITVSEFSKSEIINLLDVPEEVISVVPPAVADVFRTTWPKKVQSQVRERYGLPKQFILSVGTLEPRKNLLGLLNAFASLPESLQKAFPLIIAGADGWRMNGFEKLISKLEARGGLIRLGYVCSGDLPVLYSLAELVAYPSFYEGFGMPVAEAMAAGTCVLTSNQASMPEVAAGAAELVDPYDVESIAFGLERVLSDSALNQSLAARGKQYAEAYTWSSSASNLIHALKQVS
ncbi:MAG: glycosyltransferase family 4 protein [Pseudomonadales bacterium]|nr:glycosyltransferase family 4 protein [Pseudomonadales bacterium]